MLYKTILCTLLIVTGCGCTSKHYHSKAIHHVMNESPVELQNKIQIEKDLTFEENVIETTNNYILYDVSIKHNNQEITKLTWYNAVRGKKPRPLDFIWPILAGKNAPVAQIYATQIFAPLGIDAVIIGQKEKLFKTKPLRSVSEIISFNQEMIRHILRAIAWAKQKTIFDQNQFGLTGTSYGGILTAVCIPFTQDFISHKIVMGAGNIPEILGRSVERGVVKWRDAILKELEHDIRKDISSKNKLLYYDLQDIYEKWIAAEAYKQFIEKTQEMQEWDPNQFAQYGNPQKIAMVITKQDAHVPTKNQLELWTKLGKPDALFVNTGHYTLALAFFQVQSYLCEITKKHYHLP